ncbi:MAG TPA: hypothetical protein VMB48_10810, partial [Steroidobacteraceae bacterium]|nr:hypothetical protein [Steroidobacteraceae bacterium]
MSAPRPSTELLRRLAVEPRVLRQLAAAAPARYPALFDSAVTGPTGQLSILAAQPTAALWLTPDGRLAAAGMEPRGPGFLAALEHWWRSESLSPAQPAAVPGPFSPGWVVFLGYELMAEIEPRLVLPRTPLPWAAFALRTPCALVHVLATGEVWAVGEPGSQSLLETVALDALRAQDAPEPAFAPGSYTVT